MELVEIFRTLARHKVALVGVFVVAALVAYLGGSKLGGAAEYGSAQGQVLVDSPQSALANLKQDTVPLTTRAGVFAQFMASSSVRDEIAKATGIPASQIVARGPFDDPAVAPAGTAVPNPPAPPDASNSVTARPYQLTFVAQEELPLVTVYGQAPTAADAKKLVDGVAVGVKAHIDHMQDVGQLDAKDRVVIRGLGPAEAGTVAAGSAAPVTLGLFVFLVLLGCGGVLMYARVKDGDEAGDDLDFDDDHVDGDLEEFLTQVDFDDEPQPINGNGGRKVVEDAPQHGAPAR